MTTRENWKSRSGFLLAAIGSAIGLGNIWRFPYVAYKNGGGAFLIPYLVAIILIGLPLMVLEQSLGQRFQGAAPQAYARLKKPFELLGWFTVVVVGFGIQIYYAVVLSWCLNYFKFSTSLAWGSEPGKFFEQDFLNFTGGSLAMGNLQWPIVSGLILVWVICWAVLSRGIQKGIEAANRIFMPLLFLLMVILVVWSFTLDGAMSGVSAYLTPDFSRLSDPAIWQDAFGQIFFTLSLGMGIMIAYSSYLPKENVNIASNARITVFANCGFEVFAGFAVFATLGFMATSMSVPITEVAKGGPGLAFVTYPSMINQLPIGQPLFGAIFFLNLIFAGITSAISINEAFISALIHKFGWRRQPVVATICMLGLLFGLVFTTQSGLAYLDIMDYFLNHFGLIAIGFLEAVLVGWLIGTRAYLSVGTLGMNVAVRKLWIFAIALFIPVVLGYLLIVDIYTNIKSPYSGYAWDLITVIGLGWIVMAFLVALVFHIKKPHPGCEAAVNVLQEE